MSSPQLVGVGSVFIDDIVLPTGQTYMGCLGGGVVHALMGAAIWGERPGILATVGQGLPADSASLLSNYFDTGGLVTLALPQIRAWQLFEDDGTRRELYRVKETLPFIRGAQPEHLPQAFAHSKAYYLLQGIDEMRRWRQCISGLVLWEPLQQVMIPENTSAVRRLLSECQIDILSPNLIEAKAIYGDWPPTELITAMLSDGAQTVALRMGEAGSLVADRDGNRVHIDPLSSLNIIDQTGAGNTYCGAFLAGLVQGKSLLEAGVMATVAASFCLEKVGVAIPDSHVKDQRDQRYNHIKQKTAICR